MAQGFFLFCSLATRYCSTSSQFFFLFACPSCAVNVSDLKWNRIELCRPRATPLSCAWTIYSASGYNLLLARTPVAVLFTRSFVRVTRPDRRTKPITWTVRNNRIQIGFGNIYHGLYSNFFSRVNRFIVHWNHEYDFSSALKSNREKTEILRSTQRNANPESEQKCSFVSRTIEYLWLASFQY